ncbi:hypothetical protein BDQ12DRAFT_528723 [Crucibulum laeve]|uniref:Uncharacterized protein n=1 Tax=Crucibulum laeve TaxID=68775 RepID=A0A5C3LJK6_9AGAR|nr:hypothetical protein BDQ12DRAFT_528723 [Crucibulum laeve]
MDSDNSPPPTPKRDKLEDPSSDDLTSYFERSASTVQDYTGKLEHDYARPLIQAGTVQFQRRPIPATFFGIFFALSSVPTISFIVLSVLTILTIMTIAIVSGVIASVLLLLLLVTLLISTLLFILFVSIFLTGLVLSSYLFLKLILSLRQFGLGGIASWITETKQLVLGSVLNTQPASANTKPPGPPPSAHDSSGPANPMGKIIPIQQVIPGGRVL